MSNAASATTAKPSSSVKLVLLGEAAVGKVSFLYPSHTAEKSLSAEE